MTRQRGKPQSKRQLRVGEELRHALAAVLARGDLRDPELRDLSITVTEVRASPDLRNATVYVLPLGGAKTPADTEAMVGALRRAGPYLRGQIAREVVLRFTPALSFEADTSFDRADRIDSLLRAATSHETAPAEDLPEDGDGT